MANTLTNIMPKILARALMSLRTRCIMPRIVNSSYSIEAAKKGSTIDVPVPVAVATEDVVPSNTPVAPGALVPGTVQISLDNWKQNTPIGLTDNEMTQIDENAEFLPMQLEEAIKALASDVNQQIISNYAGASRGIYGFISNPDVGVGTIVDPFGAASSGNYDTAGVSAATNAKKVLNQQLCPRSDRRVLLNFDAEARALDLSAFSDADKIMSAVVKMEGEIGRKFGMDFVADDDVPDHTVGTAYMASPADLTVEGAEVIGNTSIGLIDAGAGTVVIGDIITIAGDSQTYCVVGAADYTLHASVPVEVSIRPALKTTLSGTEVVSLKNSHAVNLAFHRDAFAFATRPLLANAVDYSLGSKMLSMQDSVTGLVLRLEVSRQHKQTVWEFDILWGSDLVREELAMRIAGAV